MDGGSSPLSKTEELFARFNVDTGVRRKGVEEIDVISAFAANATWQRRSSAIVHLAKAVLENERNGTVDSVARDLSSRILLLVRAKDAHGMFAALRFLCSLYTVAAELACSVLFDFHVLACIITRSDAQPSSEEVVHFLLAELLSLASSHAGSRKKIKERTERADHRADEAAGGNAKIKEIINEDQDDTLRSIAINWLAAFVERAELENPAPEGMLSKTALLCALALHKLVRSRSGDEENRKSLQGLSEQQDNEAKGKEDKLRKEEDLLLYELSRRHILLGRSKEEAAFKDACPFELDSSVVDELARSCQASAIESLSYLSLESARYKSQIANDGALLSAICKAGKIAAQQRELKDRYDFPSRQTANPSREERTEEQAPDTALQFGVASLLASIVTYATVKGKEEIQMDKLRRMANAKSTNETSPEEDEHMSNKAVEQRVSQLIEAKGVETLVAIALAKHTGSAASGVHSSASVRDTIAKAFLGITTKQDKLQRGQVIQQGGARALLALANKVVADAAVEKKSSDTTTTDVSFLAAQALAHLLISEIPSLILAEPLEAVPSLVLLYLHDGTNSLQRFEASLALTNVASLSPQMARHIALFGYSRQSLAVRGASEFVGVDRATDASEKVIVASIVRERIFVEDNELSRRASMELLCNLLVVDEVFTQWSGEREDEEEKGNSLELGRAVKDLAILIALCAPVGWSESAGETGLKMRLASSGAVATLCSSPSTCARIFALGPRVLNRVCRLIKPGMELDQTARIIELKEGDEELASSASMAEDEAVEAKMEEEDVGSDHAGKEHGLWQLALRGVTIVECLVQYVSWLGEKGPSDITEYKSALKAAGVVESVKYVATAGAHSIKNSSTTPPRSAAVSTLQMQVTRQSLEVLKALQSIGLLNA